MARRANTRLARGVHCIDTEVRSLSQALNIIREQNKKERARLNALEHHAKHPLTLKQELALLRGRLAVQRLNKKRKPHEKLPHPFRDLPPEQQAQKVREMYDCGHGHWGIGIVAFKRLAKLFRVPVGQIIVWIEQA